MRSIITIVALCGIAGLLGAGIACESAVDCAPGTYESNGECIATCAFGTELGADGMCHPLEVGGDGDTDTDTDTDTDADTDTDTDTDADTDTDTDADTDADSDTDTDSDADTDSDTDADTDADTDTDTDADGDPPDPGEVAALAAALVADIVEARTATCGGDSLTMNAELTAMAQACSDLMLAAAALSGCNDTFQARSDEHTSAAVFPSGEVRGWAPSVPEVLDMFLEQPELAAHVLNCELDLAGVGISPDADGYFYVTVTFAAAEA